MEHLGGQDGVLSISILRRYVFFLDKTYRFAGEPENKPWFLGNSLAKGTLILFSINGNKYYKHSPSNMFVAGHATLAMFFFFMCTPGFVFFYK